MADLTTTYTGIILSNPIVVGSAGITGRSDLVRRAADAGAGAVVMKSLGPRHWRSPRMAILRRDGQTPTTTFYSVEGSSQLGEQAYAEEVARAKAAVNIPVIASLTAFNDDDWVRQARLIAQAGADALELDITCPHGAHMLVSNDALAEIGRVTALVKASISIPVIPKLTPQADSPVAAALTAESAGADAVTAFNRFTGLDIDVRKQSPILHGGLAGHGGPWSIYYVMRWVTEMYPRLRIPISSSGGVFGWEDVAKMLLAGATTVQTCTAVILGGYGVVTDMVRGVERYMDEMGHRTVDEFRGRAAARLQSAATIDRTRQYRAEIDPMICTECGVCAKMCIYDAARPNPSGGYAVDDRCAGCGLCAQLCPSGAISVREVGR